MYRHFMVLPDGSEIFSGADRVNVLRSVTVTQLVNSGQELTLGSVCACQMQAELITPEGGLSLSAGEAVTLYRVDADESKTKLGVFYLEKPEKTSAHTMTLTGYDAVSRLDTELTQWLAELDQWPYAASEFAEMVCRRCGLVLQTPEFPNGDFYIRPFAAERVTGRHLMQWLGQLAGRFCRATPGGDLEFAWYQVNDSMAVAHEAGEDAVFFYQGQLQYADYTTAPIEKVQLRQNGEDVGTVWPQEAGEKNTYILENNPMLAAQDSQTLLPVAQTLYAQLQQVRYTPCTLVIPATPAIAAGDILTVTDANGSSFTTYVMKKIADGQRDTLECSGSCRRDSTTAVNDLRFQALSGKVLNLRLDVEGLKVENKDAAGHLAEIYLDLEQIRGRVESQEAAVEGITGTVSTLTQTSQGLKLELETIRQNGTQKVKTGTGYTFDDKGLRISRTDSEMENLLDHTGMYVKRAGEVVLQANNQGVVARDVTVRNYLILGDNARFEDYSGNRTACFYIG